MKVSKLRTLELRQLKHVLEPYGAINNCCEQTKIHRSTISRILRTGEGLENTIERVREYLRSEQY